MISKIFITGKGFGVTCKYLCQDLNRSLVLSVEGVRGHALDLMEHDFRIQHGFMPEKEKPVFHGVLSFPPGENPEHKRLVEIGRRYLDEIGMKNTQYAMVLHTDKAHLHMHILANRVNNDGKIIGQGFIIERGIKAAEKLTLEFKLRPATGKNLALTNLDSLHEVDGKRYRLYQAIKDSLPQCTRIEDLEKRLLERGISTRYKYDPVSLDRVGISFKITNLSFKGSLVDKAFSFRGLQQTLEMNLKLELKQKQEMEQKLALEQRQALVQKQRLRPSQQEDQPVRRGMRLRR
jgi:Relaxase/Mobilisation nuclease domain